MGNTIMLDKEAFKIEGNAIKVGHTYRHGKHQRAVFEEVPLSAGNTIVIEQSPDSCFLDLEGDGSRKLREFGVSESGGRKVIDDINKIIDESDWNVAWLNEVKPKCWLCLCFFLHFIGVCCVLCIVMSKHSKIKKKRNQMMDKAKEYAKKHNNDPNSEFDIRIPYKFTEYIEVVVKPQTMARAMGMGMYQQPMMMPNAPAGGAMDYNQQMQMQMMQQQQMQMMQQQGQQYPQPQQISIQVAPK